MRMIMFLGKYINNYKHLYKNIKINMMNYLNRQMQCKKKRMKYKRRLRNIQMKKINIQNKQINNKKNIKSYNN